MAPGVGSSSVTLGRPGATDFMISEGSPTGISSEGKHSGTSSFALSEAFDGTATTALFAAPPYA